MGTVCLWSLLIVANSILLQNSSYKTVSKISILHNIWMNAIVKLLCSDIYIVYWVQHWGLISAIYNPILTFQHLATSSLVLLVIYPRWYMRNHLSCSYNSVTTTLYYIMAFHLYHSFAKLTSWYGFKAFLKFIRQQYTIFCHLPLK